MGTLPDTGHCRKHVEHIPSCDVCRACKNGMERRAALSDQPTTVEHGPIGPEASE